MENKELQSLEDGFDINKLISSFTYLLYGCILGSLLIIFYVKGSDFQISSEVNSVIWLNIRSCVIVLALFYLGSLIRKVVKFFKNLKSKEVYYCNNPFTEEKITVDNKQAADYISRLQKEIIDNKIFKPETPWKKKN